jgi:hypothetical protein
MFGGGPDIITQKPGLPGLYISAVLSLLMALAGALEIRRLLNPTDPPPVAAEHDTPRLSGLALLGALWAPCVLNAWWAWQLCVRQYFDDRAAFASHDGPFLTLGITSALLAVTAPFGATILGGVALAQIKESRGKLYGRPLAAAALLFQPMVTLALFTAYVLKPHALALWFDGWRGLSPNEIADLRARLGEALSFSPLDFVIVLAVCAFAGWLAWRKIAGGPSPL